MIESHIEARAVVLTALGPAPGSTTKFMAALFDVGPGTNTARRLAAQLGIVPTTLTSRFVRAGLPTPKSYLEEARLVLAVIFAHNNPGASLGDIAYALRHSSPQHLCRHVRRLTGRRAKAYFATMTPDKATEAFIRSMVAPYLATLRTFRPLAPQTRRAV
jgi:AraC-like DNA-binding protein